MAELELICGRQRGPNNRLSKFLSLSEAGERGKNLEDTAEPLRIVHGRGSPMKNLEPFDRKSPEVLANSNTERLTNPTLPNGHGIIVESLMR